METKRQQRKYVKRVCEFCGVDFETPHSYVRRGHGKYCSRECAGRGIQRNSVEPNTECANCNQPIYRKKSLIDRSKTGLFFCNKECQGKFFQFGGVIPRIDQKVDTRTDCCFDGCENLTNNKYCGAHVAQDNVDKWLMGDNSVTLFSNPSNGPKKFVKDYLKRTRGDQCEKCGFDEKAPDSRSIIQLNHIDGDCTNNHLDNLELLCPNCHAMTPNYGSLNKSSTRVTRVNRRHVV